MDSNNDRSAIDLDSYIALGTLIFDVSADSAASELSATSATWTEIPPSQRPLSNQTQSSLQLLINARWVRAFSHNISLSDQKSQLWRIYLLPLDVARSWIPRDNKLLRNILNAIVEDIDTSSCAWNAYASETSSILPDNNTRQPFDKWATPEGDSLHYIFNTLPSPHADPSLITDRYAKADCARLLNLAVPLRGLQTQLYPYQRRTAAMMVQREAAPQPHLDPRLERRTGPDCREYFYGPRDRTFYKFVRTYDTVAGGILAETMGLGKTLICIAVILATHGHMPRIPPQCNLPSVPIRSGGPASLLSTAAAAMHRHQIPWKGSFQDIREKTGDDPIMCRQELESSAPFYEMPPAVIRTSRHSQIMSNAAAFPMLLSSATIIVVPRNLVHQWSTELEKHVKSDTLSILVLDSPRILVPAPEKLAKYDVILFSRPRFEAENKKTEALYESPLKRIHFLRIIIDEGHDMASTKTHAAVAATKLVTAERRWIVSGTPAKDLLGVEVELGSMDESSIVDHEEYRRQSLRSRKSYDVHEEQRSGAVKALGLLASHFLRAQPWAAPNQFQLEPAANWDDHIYRHESDRERTYTSFSAGLRTTLEGLVVKTQPSDVERDLDLPPLTHTVVRLEPSLFDKLTANLFVLQFTANAVTSERRDQDYLFHKNSAHHLQRLTTNLRRSTFSWTGFLEEHVMKSLAVSESYLTQEGTLCTEEDRRLMTSTIETARRALDVAGWHHLVQNTEVGVYIEDWPKDSMASWAFPGCWEPMLIGLSPAVAAQKHINGRLSQENILDEFDVYGKEVRTKMRAAAAIAAAEDADSATEDETNIPSSKVKQEFMGSKRLSASGAATASPKRPKAPRSAASVSAGAGEPRPKEDSATPQKRRRRLSTGGASIDLAPDSQLGRARIVGTTSSKLTYLIDRVIDVHQQEKTLIFFNADYIAYYISQVLDILHIKHLIYASSLSGEARSKYIVLFNSDPAQRVLLMDIKQAAHGLNLSSASRVFFVNPAYRPDIEAQAIKRAHRIGQERPVHVETLVLSGTVEEAVHRRASKMTQSEHRAARTLEEDEGIRGIIQSARVMAVSKEEMCGRGQMARLSHGQQIFGRPGRKVKLNSGMEEDIFGAEDAQGECGSKRRKATGPKGRGEAKASDSRRGRKGEAHVKRSM